MMIEEALKAQLVAYAPLNALIAGRVYPLFLSETAQLPALTYQRISTTPLRHRGASQLERIRYQVDGWSTKYLETLELRKQMRAALELWAKESAPRVDITLLQDDRDLREPTNGRYRASVDFMLFATES